MEKGARQLRDSAAPVQGNKCSRRIARPRRENGFVFLGRMNDDGGRAMPSARANSVRPATLRDVASLP